MDINKTKKKPSKAAVLEALESFGLPEESESAFLALLPLKNVVILPKSIIPIIVGRQSSIQAVEFALKNNKTIFITSQKDSKVENPGREDVFEYGTRSTILQVMRMPNGALKILAEGICRARIVRTEPEHDFLGVYCQDMPTTHLGTSAETEAIWRQLKAFYLSYARLNEKMPTDLALDTKKPQEMDYITDTIAVHINNLSFHERQEILEIVDLGKRMLRLCALIAKEIEILETEQRIRGRVQNQVEKNQREYYLAEQMKAIHKELGREDQSAEIAALKSKAKSLHLPKEAMEKVEKELKRLEQMPPLSSEAVVSRHYVDWMISLPWHKASKDNLSLAEAEKMLSKNHAGLKKAKERIIEFIAAKKFSSKFERSPIICLVGPPGVGKTSLAQSIATSLGREFYRISLGGMRDEAEIRGHRRTYVGALPGKILHAMRRAKCVNPVILLDEIDKISRDMHGDPASALLEVLDPEQNNTFTDHFLDVEYDLSKVMFIATANMVDGIPYALYDRMEIISLAGYTDEEKIEIARKFLIPKKLSEYGLTARQFSINDEALLAVVTEYTKEAGVRQLERVLTKLMRKTIQHILNKEGKSIEVTLEHVKEWLGNPGFKKTTLNQTKERIGLATGLAWTEMGGDILEIETTVIPGGKGNLTLTGQLGEVMQESAQAALSYIRSKAKSLGIASSFYTTRDIHIHLPEGATPKDGPSAGITMCTALVSALTNNPTLNDFAMTGEITLQGRVLSVGGLKEKLLAAKQHGFKRVIVPHENFDDIKEILKDTDLQGVELIYVKTMDEVLPAAFAKSPLDNPKTVTKTTTKTAVKKPANKAKQVAKKQPTK